MAKQLSEENNKLEFDIDDVSEEIPMVNVPMVETKQTQKPISKQTNMVQVETPMLINCLKNEKIIVRFINRKYELTNNPKHVYYGGMANNAVRIFTLPIDFTTKTYTNPLTKDEQNYLEHILGLEENDLSVYKRVENFWENFSVPLRKEDNIFDLSDPMSYIQYKVLLCNNDQIASSLGELSTTPKATYQFVIVSPEELKLKESSEMTITTKAYRLFGQIEQNTTKLRYVLGIMEGKPVSDNVDSEWLVAQVHTQLKKNPQLFVDILSDKLLDIKLLIFKAVKAKLVNRVGTLYYDADTRTPLSEGAIDPTIEAAAAYIASPKKQEYKLLLEAKLNS